ncbi:MAG: Rrf2 family transcriptional regulator [Eubacterium sp.]|nr:Rrf2 family transcriptional regulator [Eubacterium sp.]
MKISTKGRYALRLMLDIAQHNNGEPVRVKDISRRQEISIKYLEQIISALVKSGYLHSIRGPQGGYMLNRQPSDYKIGDILRVTEGSLAPVECLSTEENTCPREAVCVTLRLWKELDQAIKGVVDKYTLQDLLNWSQEGIMDYVI